MTRTIPLLAAATVVLLAAAACTSDPKPDAAAPASPTTAPRATPTRTGPDDPAGLRACQLAQQIAHDTSPVPDRGVIDQLSQAAMQSTNTSIRAGSISLSQSYAIASAAAATHGGDQTSTRLNLTTAVMEMLTTCIKAGYPVGP